MVRPVLPPPIALLLALVAGCEAGPAGRERTIAAAGRLDSVIAHGAVARELRAPPDSSRIIYTRPTPLARPTATAAGAGNPTAPFGISTPDTAQAGSRPRPRTGGPRGTAAAPRPPGAR